MRSECGALEILVCHGCKHRPCGLISSKYELFVIGDRGQCLHPRTLFSELLLAQDCAQKAPADKREGGQHKPSGCREKL